MEKFTKLKEDERPLKIDKDLLEIQKTVIYYGDSMLLEMDKISTLIRTMLQQKEKDKGKAIELSEKPKTIDKETENSLVKHLRRMKIPHGYKGNDQY